nr:MAG TPA: hypothetical protein [Caudoviricetes sp.]
MNCRKIKRVTPLSYFFEKVLDFSLCPHYTLLVPTKKGSENSWVFIKERS